MNISFSTIANKPSAARRGARRRAVVHEAVGKIEERWRGVLKALREATKGFAAACQRARRDE
jgi:hypothetical protein